MRQATAFVARVCCRPIDEIVLSLTAKGLTTGEVAAYFADVYGATVSKDTISADHRQGGR